MNIGHWTKEIDQPIPTNLKVDHSGFVYIDIRDVKIELDLILNLSSIENGLQYQYIVWI